MPTMAEICGDLRNLQYYRRFYTKLVNRQCNAAAAIVRRELFNEGLLEVGEKGGPADPKGIGAKVVSTLMNKKEPPSECPAEIIERTKRHVNSMLFGVEPILADRDAIELNMKKLARQLPVHEWQESVKGFGDLALAAVVGTAGDVSLYPNPDKLKKRLGLASYQGRAMSTWRSKGGLTSEDWTTLKYDPKALSVVFADVTEPMLKHQLLGEKNKANETGEAQPKGPYGKYYLDYKKRQAEQHGEELSKGHIAMRARRYMAQKLIIDMWCCWHGKTINTPAWA